MNRREYLKVSGLLFTGTPMFSMTTSQETQNENKTEEYILPRSPEPSKPFDHIQWSRSIPVKYDADVVVIGAGIAGVSAAAAAAKSGAKVALIERFAVTGGMLTTGGVASFCGSMTKQGEVFDEIVTGLQQWKALKKNIFDHEILAVILQEFLLKRNIKLLLHTRFADVVQKSNKITECILIGKSGVEAIRGKVFIDCSGEGDVARAAGCEIMKGREEDGLQLPMSLMYFIRHVDPKETQPQLPEGWFHPVKQKESLPMTSLWPNGPRSNAIKIKIPMFDSTDTESLTAAEIQARRRMMEVLYYHQVIEKKPWRFDHCSPIIGIREGCRIVGDYVLTVDDLRAGREFDDAVARGEYVLDGHKPDDDKRTYILDPKKLSVPPYQIPLRSLIAKDCKNLLMAGRCFSADQLALSSARVSTSGSMMGQAAGITAALVISSGKEVRNIDAAEVRKIIEQRGGSVNLRLGGEVHG